MPEEPSWSPGPAPGPRSRCSHGTPSCGWQWLRGSPRSTALRGRGIRTSVRAASDDARWVIVAEHLEELRSAVRFERPASLLRQIHGVGRPRCFAYFDHHPCNPVIAADLPQPAAAATLGARVRTEVCPDLPMVELRIVHHTLVFERREADDVDAGDAGDATNRRRRSTSSGPRRARPT